MSIRVRKLAKQMGRTPEQVLGLLLAIGNNRYRNADDMLPDEVVARLHRAEKEGTKALPVAPLPAPPPPAAGPAKADLMSRLVPGVVRQGERPAPAAAKGPRPVEVDAGPVAPTRPSAPAPRPNTGWAAAGEGLDQGDLMSRLVPGVVRSGPPPAPAKAAPPVTAPMKATWASGGAAHTAAVDGERRALQLERETLDSVRRRLDAEADRLDEARRALQEDRDVLLAEREVVLAEREALDGERQALMALREALSAERAVSRPSAETATGLADLLTERGLRGPDEAERALTALGQGRILGELLPRLQVTNPEALRKLLLRRLVLVDGPVPEGLPSGLAAVSVAPERAEIPVSAILKRQLSELSEQLLLSGLRRVLVAGGNALAHRLLREGLDPRIEMRVQAATPRDRAGAEADVTRIDVVVLWGVPVGPDARPVYDRAQALVVEFSEVSLGGLLQTWLSRVKDR
jgi:hypothetical protein